VYAYFQKQEADNQTIEAVFQKLQADSLLGVSEKNRLRADERTNYAEEQEKEANKQALAALLANENTDKALKDLKITSDQAVTILLAEINRNIYRLEYDSTYRKCQTALNLKAQRGAVEKCVWEIAYFYTEADTLAAACTFLNLLEPTGLTINTPGLQAKLRALLKKSLPPAYLTFLKERYFPRTIPVEGGLFLRRDSVRVKVNGFRMAETETTFWQYNVFAKATGHYIAPPSWQYAGDNPAVNVNWFDAAFYLNWLNDRDGLKHVYTLTATGEKGYGGWDLYDVEIDSLAKGYRLPSEAEWEFAARGGNNSKEFEYSGDPDINEVAWYDENSGSRTHSVRQKKANELGLYDMSGNVWEWCRDWYDEYDPEKNDNPVGAVRGTYRVLRGGSWGNYAEGCRTAYRLINAPAYRNDAGYGFRLVFVP
jgi:formylglycine-generating enzyme required for sulfatase activity